MSLTKQPRAAIAVLTHGLGAVLLAAWLVHSGATTSWLYLLVGPVFLASIRYPRWVYLTMTGVCLVVAVTVVRIVNPEVGAGLRNVGVVVAVVVTVAELLHRTMEARLRAEIHLRELLRALQDSDQRKIEFLAVLAHELRNPLAAI